MNKNGQVCDCVCAKACAAVLRPAGGAVSHPAPVLCGDSGWNMNSTQSLQTLSLNMETLLQLSETLRGQEEKLLTET